MTVSKIDEVFDPTTAAIAASNDEREKLRTEVARLEHSLMAAHLDIETLTKLGDALFIEGYDQAIGEIRNHFAKVKETEIVAEIEKIWLKDKQP